MKRGLPGFVLAALCLSLVVSLAPALQAEDADLAQLRGKAEKGNVLAQYNLGLAYSEGRGIPVDLVEAYVWLRLAAENGGTGNALSSVLHQMSIEQIAAGRLRLDERRHATPGVVPDHRSASSAGAPAKPPAAPPPAPAADRLAAMQEEISNLRVDNERLTQQLSSLQSGPARAGVSTALETQKRLTDREAEMEALRKELASARKANDDLAAQAKKLLDDQETLKRQLADRSGASQRLAAAENQRDEARKELEALKAREEELERDLRDQLAKAQAENESLTAAGQRLEDREHTGAGLTGQLAEAQSTIEQLKRENAGLKVQRAEPANQPAAAPAGTSDADELARLKDDLKRANSKVEMTVRSFTLLQEENERLKAQLAQTKTP